jgi:hypothetical protein
MRYERSVPDVLADLLTQCTSLFRKESQLVRAEMSDKVRRVALGLATVIAGTVLMIPAFVILLEAAVAALERAGYESQWAALIVGGAAAIVGLIMVMVGLNAFKADKLVPEKTIHQLRQDASVATRPMRQGDEQQRAA